MTKNITRMNINSDINILGGLPDWNLIRLFMNDSIESLNQLGGHRSYTAIKTDKAVKRFEKAIARTLLQFKNKELELIFRNMISTESISNDSLLFIFWNASDNNDLFNYLNESIYFPAMYSGRVGIRTPEVEACLNELKQTEQDLKKWADSTIQTTASKYLTLLKKLNLMEGSLNKTITHTYLNDKMFVIFIYWILSVETKSNLLESVWLKYSFLEKQHFLDRILQKKFSKFFNINFNGDYLKIEPVVPYNLLYDALTQL